MPQFHWGFTWSSIIKLGCAPVSNRQVVGCSTFLVRLPLICSLYDCFFGNSTFSEGTVNYIIVYNSRLVIFPVSHYDFVIFSMSRSISSSDFVRIGLQPLSIEYNATFRLTSDPPDSLWSSLLASLTSPLVSSGSQLQKDPTRLLYALGFSRWRAGDLLFVLPGVPWLCTAFYCFFVQVQNLRARDDGQKFQCLGLCGSDLHRWSVFKFSI